MTFSSDNPVNTNQVPISLDVNLKDKDFDNILMLYLRRVANAVNTKVSGLFLLQENANFHQWFQDGNPQQNRNAYRTSFDLVALNLAINASATIPNGLTNNLTLTSSTQPSIIKGYKFPVNGFGGAIDANGISYFLNDPNIYVTYNSSTNTIIIQNNTGVALTWCVWVMEYLKN